MTVSMRVMSAGDGYKYLLKTIAAADGDRRLSTPLTRYYMEEGTPPGRWLGTGVAALGKGEIQVGDRVSEHQLQLLMGRGHDPITDEPLGRAFPTYKSQDERIEARIADLEPTMTPGAKGEAVAQIVAEETARNTRRAVAAFDFTFSIPKSAGTAARISDTSLCGAVRRYWKEVYYARTPPQGIPRRCRGRRPSRRGCAQADRGGVRDLAIPARCESRSWHGPWAKVHASLSFGALVSGDP